MSDTVFEAVEAAATLLKLDMTAQELALFAESKEFTQEELNAVRDVFSYLSEKKRDNTI